MYSNVEWLCLSDIVVDKRNRFEYCNYREAKKFISKRGYTVMDTSSHKKEFLKKFLILTITISLQNVVVLSVNLADNLMLGAYSEASLSGVAVSNQIQFILQMVVMGIAEGIVILASRSWGRKDTGPIKTVTGIALKIGLVLVALLFLTVLLFPEFVLGLFTNEQDVIAEGVSYIRIVCFSYLPFCITNLLLAMMRSVETVRIGFVTSVMTLLINVSLNYLLIGGNLGFPELGVRGAAIATLTARCIETVTVIIYVRFIDKKVKAKLREFLKGDRDLFRRFVPITAPIFAGNVMWGVAMAIQTGILGHMGGAAISANSIATTIFQLVSVIAYATASATAVVIGKTIGSGHVDRVRGYAGMLQIVYLLVGIATGLVLFLIKDAVIGLYNISDEARSLALTFMGILSVTVVGTSYQMPCLTGLVRAGGDTKFVFYNDLIFMWGLVLPASLIAAFVLKLSPAAVFICLKADQILKCTVAVVKVNRFRWIKG